MQKLIYTCDQCSNIMGDKKHFSLRFAQDSGIAVPDKGMSTWSIHQKMQGKYLHFCNGKCIADYFKAMLAKVTA